jgi:hypothetical protein
MLPFSPVLFKEQNHFLPPIKNFSTLKLKTSSKKRSMMGSGPEENLYHLKRTMIDYHKDPSGATQDVRICRTYTDLHAAKAAARYALFNEGYEMDWFPTFEYHSEESSWKHGDGIMVFAVAPDGEQYTVGIETAPNALNLKGNNQGQVEKELFHVLQTTIFTDKNPSGASRETNIEGTWESYEAAKLAADKVLLDADVSKDSFVKYDENVGKCDWKYGDDVVVHAVGVNGDNILVSIVKGVV